jgi:hypothetical protein
VIECPYLTGHLDQTMARLQFAVAEAAASASVLAKRMIFPPVLAL